MRLDFSKLALPCGQRLLEPKTIVAKDYWSDHKTWSEAFTIPLDLAHPLNRLRLLPRIKSERFEKVNRNYCWLAINSANALTTVTWVHFVKLNYFCKKFAKYQTLSSIFFFWKKSSGHQSCIISRWIQSRRSLKIFANFHRDQILLLKTQSDLPQTTFTKRKLTSHKIWGWHRLKILENETEKIDDSMWVAVTPACGRADFKRKDTSESNAIQTRSRPGVNP